MSGATRKIVALVPFRDEAALLPYWLVSLSPVVDGIVALDDGSTDGGADALRQAGATVLDAPSGASFGRRRQLLLEEGRRAGGTHFVVLDADEAFTAPLSRNGRRIIEALPPGTALSLRDYTLWKGPGRYRVGSEYDMPQTCIFADDGVSSYPDTFIHESRVPPALAPTGRVLPASDGAMVHLQFAVWRRAQMKQAWYRCKELLGGSSATRVNARYRTTLDGPLVRSRPLDPALLAGLPPVEPLAELPPSWHLAEVLSWFDTHGPAHFEALQIWHVPELQDAFEAAEGRRPRSQRVTPVVARLVGDAYGSTRALSRRLVRRIR